ncbi:MAG: hypothetical protein HPY66_1995 [Firmicutes bacterium]|nr:hypothetical protein [Bacillota bacterium]MDI6705253.1 hypothetical protein [Bacillota bacterium]
MTRKSQLDPHIQDRKDIPLLIHEDVWLDFFNTYCNVWIKVKYSKLVRLDAEAKEIERLLESTKKDKKKNMNKVIVLSGMINNEGNEAALSELEETQALIQHLNNEIETLESRRLSVNERKRKLNFDILNDTVKIAYKEIKKQERILENISGEIEGLKEMLNRSIDRKHGIEEQKNQLYRLVHGLIGRDETNKMDDTYLET